MAMGPKMIKTQLQTHSLDSVKIEKRLIEIRDRLINAGDTEIGPLSEKLSYLQELSEFEYGRFLILNGGLNGRWSHYAFYEYPRLEDRSKIHPLELKLLDSQFMQSNQERTRLVHTVLLPELFDGISILSVPCGVMSDLICLDYSKIKNFKVLGIDLDEESLTLARAFAEKHKIQNNIRFEKQDAWNLKLENEFDVIVSIGLNMYSPNLEIAMSLYRTLYSKLKMGGKLIISFLTPDISFAESERDATLVLPDEIHRQALATELYQVKYQQHTCTSNQIVKYLVESGFTSVSCHYSKFRAFNIALATK